MVPHVVIDRAFGEALAERLYASVVAHEARAEAGRVGGSRPGGRVDTSVRRALVIDGIADAALEADIAARIDAQLPEVRRRLGLTPFTPGAKQISTVVYGDGAFYARHADTAPRRRPGDPVRHVTFVYYFSREPRAFTGGELRLYGIGGRGSIDLEPRQDRLVAFPSWIEHEVLPVACAGGTFGDGRFAANIWVLDTGTAPA